MLVIQICIFNYITTLLNLYYFKSILCVKFKKSGTHPGHIKGLQGYYNRLQIVNKNIKFLGNFECNKA